MSDQNHKVKSSGRSFFIDAGLPLHGIKYYAEQYCGYKKRLFS